MTTFEIIITLVIVCITWGQILGIKYFLKQAENRLDEISCRRLPGLKSRISIQEEIIPELLQQTATLKARIDKITVSEADIHVLRSEIELLKAKDNKPPSEKDIRKAFKTLNLDYDEYLKVHPDGDLKGFRAYVTASTLVSKIKNWFNVK